MAQADTAMNTRRWRFSSIAMAMTLVAILSLVVLVAMSAVKAVWERRLPLPLNNMHFISQTPPPSSTIGGEKIDQYASILEIGRAEPLMKVSSIAALRTSISTWIAECETCKQHETAVLAMASSGACRTHYEKAQKCWPTDIAMLFHQKLCDADAEAHQAEVCALQNPEYAKLRKEPSCTDSGSACYLKLKLSDNNTVSVTLRAFHTRELIDYLYLSIALSIALLLSGFLLFLHENRGFRGWMAFLNFGIIGIYHLLRFDAATSHVFSVLFDVSFGLYPACVLQIWLLYFWRKRNIPDISPGRLAIYIPPIAIVFYLITLARHEDQETWLIVERTNSTVLAILNLFLVLQVLPILRKLLYGGTSRRFMLESALSISLMVLFVIDLFQVNHSLFGKLFLAPLVLFAITTVLEIEYESSIVLAAQRDASTRPQRRWLLRGLRWTLGTIPVLVLASLLISLEFREAVGLCFGITSVFLVQKNFAASEQRRRFASIEAAGTMLHEMNNRIWRLRSSIQTLRDGLEDLEADPVRSEKALALLREDARAAYEAADEIARVRNKVLTKLRDVPTSELETRVNLTILLREVAASSLIEAQHRGKRVEIHIVEVPSIALVNGDEDQVKSWLSGIIANSLDAFPDHGRVEIRVRELNVNLEIDITDNGPGPSEHDVSLMSLVAFTTKVGEGRGGFLRDSRLAIESWGGELRITRSTPAGGCTVIILLPRWQPESTQIGGRP